MDTRLRVEIICHSYNVLTDLLVPIEACRDAHLPVDLLRNHNVTVSSLDWHPENHIDFEPRYCEPFPSEEFDELFEQTKATNYWKRPSRMRWDSSGYSPEEAFDESTRRLKKSDAASAYLEAHMGLPDEPQHMAAKSDWLICSGEERYKCRGLRREMGSPSTWTYQQILRSLPWPQPELPTDEKRLEKIKRKLRRVCRGDLPIALDESLRRPGRKSLVHMAIISRDDSDICEDRILRSELTGALCIMREGLRQRVNWKQHAIFPVFVYSWSAFHVRVLQVHYDFISNSVMVRKTSYIEIDGPERKDEIKLMLRWMMNKPTGATRWEDLDMRNMDSQFDSDSDSTGKPRSPRKHAIQCH